MVSVSSAASLAPLGSGALAVPIDSFQPVRSTLDPLMFRIAMVVSGRPNRTFVILIGAPGTAVAIAGEGIAAAARVAAAGTIAAAVAAPALPAGPPPVRGPPPAL